MKIKHTLSNNKLEITVSLAPRTHTRQKVVTYTTDKVIKYCKKNDLPVGELISADVSCTNQTGLPCSASWTFSIDKEYKKHLTSKLNSSKIKEEVKRSSQKKTSARSRARNIVKSNRRKKTETDEKQPD